ncbi:GIY-YIG nuclease family protein [Sediminibacillus dalangtanensis]|uniref:GIY-YIG nuclease family protein n=1 Tax=Sediminibacillus dalangtanensis TaxID=2729421 RepID=A0ABX7VZM2_9BACI|nr:GIY-YIG nuclease family protein [Sediminibacillus dalangtanensis]QTN01241.1 GIY-YIG nuclease family protein [Sediminibacillus dalangtanensis]
MENDKTHMVYMLQCNDGTLYTGYTNNLKKRITMHENGKGAKYTRGRGPFQLVFCQSFSSKEEAMHEEYQIKQLSRKQKDKLIKSFTEGHDGR